MFRHTSKDAVTGRSKERVDRIKKSEARELVKKYEKTFVHKRPDAKYSSRVRY